MAPPPRPPRRRDAGLRHPPALTTEPPRGFTPDPERLYEVGRDGVPYTLSSLAPGAEEDLERRARRWWVAAVLLNALTTGIAAAAVLGPRSGAAWAGLLPILTAPLLLVPIAMRRRGLRRARSVHRARPDRFPRP